jgi:MFS family permease
MAVTVLAAAGFMLGGGRVSDLARSRVPVLFAFLGVSFLGFGLLAASDSLGVLVTACVLIGAGQGGTSGPLMAMLADLTPEGHMGRAMGTNNILGDLGGGLGPLVTLPLIDSVGFAPIYAACAIVPVLAGGILLIGLYSLFQLEPLGYHVVNIAVLAATAVLFYLSLRRLGIPRFLTLTIPLVFALLPHYSTDRFWIGSAVEAEALAFVLREVRVEPSDSQVRVLIHDGQADARSVQIGRKAESFWEGAFDQVTWHIDASSWTLAAQVSRSPWCLPREGYRIGSLTHFQMEPIYPCGRT